ncbi:DUF1642 domain-containing protein [Lacticaseibacillus suibinensis]|uniref:DUF1642 domain-containing protein n=1 Tax=Lacticaseibacillus suibinensis TaxID=2486011 RepID=UPI000F779E07|nr:DUF1642 domain-containing protein [Lacticaseibacillus suibinensis]
MSLYAVKNDNGEWWDFEAYDGFWSDGSCECAVTAYQERADSVIKEHGGHVVELVEKPEPEVVSQNEAKMLKEALKDDNYGAGLISDYVDEHWDDYGSLNRTHIQDRLMRAYVNGWTVEKPKRYVLPMPGTEYHNIQMHGNAQYYAIKRTENWRPDAIALGTEDAVKHGYTVTHADIDAAPGWVKAITPVEVTDDGMGC